MASGSGGFEEFSEYMNRELDELYNLQRLLESIWPLYKNITPWRMDSGGYVKSFRNIDAQINRISAIYAFPEDESRENAEYMYASRRRAEYLDYTRGVFVRSKSRIEETSESQPIRAETFLGLAGIGFVGSYDLIDAVSLGKTGEMRTPRPGAVKSMLWNALNGAVSGAKMADIEVPNKTFYLMDIFEPLKPEDAINGHFNTFMKFAEASLERGLFEGAISRLARMEGSGHMERLHYFYMLGLSLMEIKRDEEERAEDYKERPSYIG